MLKGKKAIIIGDKDGIPASIIEECLKSIDVEILLATTECYSCKAIGIMEHSTQQKILDLCDENKKDNIIVVLGIGNKESVEQSAEALLVGDELSQGPLSNIALGLDVYHVFELKEFFLKSVYEEMCEVMELVLDVKEITESIKNIREKA